MPCQPVRPIIAGLMAASVIVLPASAWAQSLPGEIVGHEIKVPGTRVAGTTSRLSEVEAGMVARLAPQGQAERLLQYAISRHSGATDEITRRVDGWRGRITRTSTIETLVEVALNGSDLRVRAAALEIELAAMNIGRTTDDAARLLARVQSNAKPYSEIWMLGALANRGVDAERILATLRELSRSPDEDVRFWALTAIANVGTDETIADLAAAFRRDPSRRVRLDAGGCGLAHSGMLTRAQRMLSLPAILDMVEDPLLDREMVAYGFFALREITDAGLPDDAVEWRRWYAAHGAEVTERFRKFDAGRQLTTRREKAVLPSPLCLRPQRLTFSRRFPSASARKV